MTQNQVYGYGYRLLRSLFISGIISFVLPVSAIAQRIPIADDTLGDERSVISPDEVINGRLSNSINGGARRGANLFHSFQEFNIDNGRGAYFTNPDGVANILARVTGGTRSDILGTLGVAGSANLFLLNPNGILFGPNAQLDIRGSFIASTANSFLFDNGFAFGATDPQEPPLLTVNVPIGLQYGINPGEVRSQGASLQVDNGQTLTLAGGTATINRGQLFAPGGRVELAGIAAPGEIGLTQQGQEWRLNVPGRLARADVFLTDGASVNVRAGGGGSIAINARNVNILGVGTLVQARINAGLGFVGATSGDIDVNAEQAVNIAVGGGVAGGIYNGTGRGSVGDSGNVNITTRILRVSGSGARLDNVIFGTGRSGNINIVARDSVSFEGDDVAAVTSLEETGRGSGGDIIITTRSLSFTGGAGINASTYGVGNAGNVIINTRDSVTFEGRDGFGGSTTVVYEASRGDGGDIIINTRSLRVTGGADLSANTRSEGNAGNVIINARDTVTFDGERDGFYSRATSSVAEAGNGNGGRISITTGSLRVTGGAYFGTQTSGQGNAGNIIIRARDAVFFDGVDNEGFGSGAYSTVGSGAIGRGGNIRITTGRLSLTNGAQVTAATFGNGNAGTITFNAPTITASGGARVLAETTSVGNGGSIVVNAPTSVNLRRINGISPVLSVETSGAGEAGDITINTPSLTLAEQARITATAAANATNPQGGGSVTINASDLNLAGTVGVFAETQGRSPAGTLRLNPYRNQPDLDITLTPGSQISASTSSSGRGGDLIVTAPRAINITGPGQLAVETSGTGNAGNMRFTTRQLTLSDGVELSASTSGTGQAGDISINADVFTLSGGAQVSTNTFSSGLAGNLTVQVSDQLFLSGRGTGLFASTTSRSTGNGGNIEIDPRLVQLEDGATIEVDSRGRGTGGNITLRSDQLVLNQSSITAETASTQGGNITLQVPDLLLLRNHSRISTTAGTAQAGGDGGNINFDGQFIVAVPNENSDMSANAFTGQGGNVSINAESLLGIEFRSQPTTLSDITASSTFGAPGAVSVNTPDVDPNRGAVQLPTDVTDASRLIAQTCPTGDVADSQSNEFVITGRGGLPPTPNEAVNQDAIQVDLVTTHVVDESSTSQTEPSHYHSSRSPESPVVEAQGWQVATNGEVMLVATVPQRAIAPSPNPVAHCH